MKDKIRYKWTVFFLVKNVETYIDPVVTMIREISEAKIGKDISIVLCLNCLVNGIKRIDPEYRNKFCLNDLDKTTAFYRVAASKNFTDNKLEFIEENPKFNIKDKHDVKMFFKKKILRKNTAKQYILFTWDHGSAFGMFRDQNEADGIVANKLKNQDIFLNFKFRETLKSAKLSKENKAEANALLFADEFDMLTMDELRDAIRWAFGKKKIDLVIMMNCYMQFFDTGYALRNQVKYLIASEALVNIEDGFGYDYSKILSKIASEKNISLDKFASDIVEIFKERYYQSNDMTKTALTANSLKYYSEISKMIDKLSRLLTGMLKKDIDYIKNSVIDSGEISFSSSYHLVDLTSFLTILKERIHNPSIERLYEKYIGLMGLAVKNPFISENVKKYVDGKEISPGGFSVFFPDYKPLNNPFYSTFILESSPDATEFSKYHKWDNFIKEYLDKN